MITVPKRPRAGEIVLAGPLTVLPGGKGANQGLAAARLGAVVTLMGKVGSDNAGELLRTQLRSHQVNDEFLFTSRSRPTGTAIVAVTPDGAKSIMLSPGANTELTSDEIYSATNEMRRASVVVVQMEIANDTLEEALIDIADNRRILMNLSPPRELSQRLLSVLDPLVLNRQETVAYLGSSIRSSSDALAAACELVSRGARSSVITIGRHGAVYARRDGPPGRIRAPAVEALDTTGAGDALIGALGVRLAEGDSLDEAAQVAVAVASQAVRQFGAQTWAQNNNPESP